MPRPGPQSVGGMRRRLQLQVPPDWTPAVAGQVNAVNDFNETVVPDLRPATDGWVTVATLWGEITPLSGQELWYAHELRPDVTMRVKIRYWKGSPALSTRMRFATDSGTRKLNVEYILPTQDKRWQEILCREEVA
jgi:SPP1 family predicted phage head-tail adaptor